MRLADRLRHLIADCLAAAFIWISFLRHSRSTSPEHTVVFSRGAFRRDIPSLGRDTLLVDIKGEWLKRFFRIALPGGWFEQIICLRYRDALRASFPLTLRTFARCVARRKARILFGGVDYFEVAIFAERAFYPESTRIVAVFHENYAIQFVENVTRALYADLGNVFRFDELYAYGPPALEILHRFAREPGGPRAMVMPRLAQMENDEVFRERLAALDEASFEKSVLLLAFPGTDYFAPLCFNATLIELATLGARGEIHPIVKFKNSGAAKSSLRCVGMLRKHVEWVYEGSVEALVWRAGVTVVFNSISLYEALLGPTLVVVPTYLDALHDENILQETERTVSELVGPLRSLLFVKSLDELSRIVRTTSARQIIEAVTQERTARKAIVNRKFYLAADAAPRA